jgi:hypothetical protein
MTAATKAADSSGGGSSGGRSGGGGQAAAYRAAAGMGVSVRQSISEWLVAGRLRRRRSIAEGSGERCSGEGSGERCGGKREEPGARMRGCGGGIHGGGTIC